MHTTPYLDSMRDVATSISEIESRDKGIHFLDSVFKNYGRANVMDLYEYYYFVHDRYGRSRDFKMSELYIDSMFWLIESTGNTNTMVSQYAKVNFSKADRLFDEGNYPEAYEYYYRAKTIAEKSSDSCTIGYYNYKIGLVLYKGGKYKDAIPYFKEALQKLNGCTDATPYFFRYQEILDNIGLSFAHSDKHDSALFYYQKALDFLNERRTKFSTDKTRFFESANAVIYGNMGSSYRALHQNKIAEDLFNKSITINSKPGYDYIDVQFTEVKLADLFIEEGRMKEAGALLGDVKKKQDSFRVNDVSLRFYKTSSNYWEKQNSSGLAYKNLLDYINLKDSLETANKLALHMDIDEHVGNLEKEGEINSLHHKNELRNVYLAIAILVAFMSLAIVLLVIQNWRKSRKNIRVLTGMNKRMLGQKSKLEEVLYKLEKSDKEKDRILKAVSHDMRSPVNSALALTDLIIADPGNITPEQMEYLELIKNSCTNALSLTKELLEIATLHSDKLYTEPADINKLINENVELLRFRAAKKKQTIKFIPLNEPYTININAERIARVINNLVTNSIKFSQLHATIDITIQKENDGVLINVRDHGIGIPANLKDKIFDIFTEAKRLGTTGEEPFGLGLSISKQIIEMHKGRIWFDSKENEGTTFYVFLPKN
jgi:signal transduction histidine kinase